MGGRRLNVTIEAGSWLFLEIHEILSQSPQKLVAHSLYNLPVICEPAGIQVREPLMYRAYDSERNFRHHRSFY